MKVNESVGSFIHSIKENKKKKKKSESIIRNKCWINVILEQIQSRIKRHIQWIKQLGLKNKN